MYDRSSKLSKSNMVYYIYIYIYLGISSQSSDVGKASTCTCLGGLGRRKKEDGERWNGKALYGLTKVHVLFVIVSAYPNDH